MHSRFPCLVLGLVLTSLLLPRAAVEAQEASVVYVVRHAERLNGAADSPLSEAGLRRTHTLVQMLADAPLATVLSTDTRRTRDTAAPVADAHALPVELYDPRAPAVRMAHLRATPGHHLVVGHSNTVPDLVRLLGGEPGEPIADHEHDRLYVVVATPEREGAVTVLLRFEAGAAAGSGEPPGVDLLEIAGGHGGGGAGRAPQR